MNPTQVWSEAFGAIFVITLEDAHERHAYVTKLMDDLGIPFEFYKAKRSPHGGRYGCFESHVEVCKIGLARGLDSVFIFEDDVMPTVSYNLQTVRDVAEFIRTNPSWERVQLGYFCMRDFKDFPGFFRFMGAQEPAGNTKSLVRFHGVLMHAYCLSRAGMQQIVNAAPHELQKKRDIPHVDMWINSLLSSEHQYCTIPLLFDQKWSFASSNAPSCSTEVLIRKFSNMCEEFDLFHKASFLRADRAAAIVHILVVTTLIVFAIVCLRKLATLSTRGGRQITVEDLTRVSRAEW